MFSHCLRLLALTLAATAAHAEFVWLECEQNAKADFKWKAAGVEKSPLLSGNRWLMIENRTQVPEDGFNVSYAVTVPKAATYEVWLRIGFEWIRPSVLWQEWSPHFGRGAGGNGRTKGNNCRIPWLHGHGALLLRELDLSWTERSARGPSASSGPAAGPRVFPLRWTHPRSRPGEERQPRSCPVGVPCVSRLPKVFPPKKHGFA